MIDSDMLKYNENTLRQITDGMIQYTMENLLKVTAEKGKRKFLVLSTEAWKIFSRKL